MSITSFVFRRLHWAGEDKLNTSAQRFHQELQVKLEPMTFWLAVDALPLGRQALTLMCLKF